ncbi:unnamed protein product [Cylindrotheca closterium]|uniref:Uncharacterized protein n=1 Tax=Cylindrotheca closterium TaxID=2856 RepID=A0AAD2CTC8_9STRA|nr:unnamed protein product [Cylindrotheca closterium]
MVRGEGSYAEFEDMEWKACSRAAVARMEEDDGAAVSTEVATCGPPLALKLSIHCPLPHTGTESALFLNGQDTLCYSWVQYMVLANKLHSRIERFGRLVNWSNEVYGDDLSENYQEQAGVETLGRCRVCQDADTFFEIVLLKVRIFTANEKTRSLGAVDVGLKWRDVEKRRIVMYSRDHVARLDHEIHLNNHFICCQGF